MNSILIMFALLFMYWLSLDLTGFPEFHHLRETCILKGDMHFALSPFFYTMNQITTTIVFFLYNP